MAKEIDGDAWAGDVNEKFSNVVREVITDFVDNLEMKDGQLKNEFTEALIKDLDNRVRIQLNVFFIEVCDRILLRMMLG
jgi:hypothetical protein